MQCQLKNFMLMELILQSSMQPEIGQLGICKTAFNTSFPNASLTFTRESIREGTRSLKPNKLTVRFDTFSVGFIQYLKCLLVHVDTSSDLISTISSPKSGRSSVHPIYRNLSSLMSISFALVVLASLASSTISDSCVRVLPSGEELPLDSIFIDSIFAASFFFEDGKCGGGLLCVESNNISFTARPINGSILLDATTSELRIGNGSSLKTSKKKSTRNFFSNGVESRVEGFFVKIAWNSTCKCVLHVFGDDHRRTSTPPPPVKTSRIFSTAASTTNSPTESTSRAPPSTPSAASLLLESTPGTSEKPDSSSPLPQLESATKDPQKAEIPSTRTLSVALCFVFGIIFLGTTSCSVVFCCLYFRLRGADDHFENDGGESRTLTEILSFRRISSHTTSKSPANPSPSTVSAKMGRALESELGPFTE
ncbi:hypothetical protein L596_017852 [Steinernema carpocapsae]|uniref:Uncharacterized protein n=1 Tax=Steinernema carpocapsae TaxID=34508 RepID=A0A4U5N368_STECR|nr:hypothetical protein L596_017852 [Steinernema carpocapsae]